MSTIQRVPSVPTRPVPPKDSLDQAGSVSRLLRYASNSPIPLTGSPVQTIYGIKEILAARSTNARVNGIVDTGSGASGILHDLTTFAVFGRSMLHLSAGLMAIASPIYAISGAVYGLLDGGRDIYNAISQKRKNDAAGPDGPRPPQEYSPRAEASIGSVKIAASGIMAAGAMSANLPLLIVGNVMYGVAVAYQNRDSIKSALHDVKARTVQLAHSIKDKGSELVRGS